MSPPSPTMDPRSSADADDAAEQARTWLAWLASAPSDDQRMAEFECWLLQPGHRRAFEYERMLWRCFGNAQGAPAQALPAPAIAVRGRWRRRLVLATAAALAVVLIAPSGWQRLQADYRSGHAVQAVTLPDGSEVVLDAGSAIALTFDAHGRHVRLLEGRAWFKVAPDPERRFSVGAGDGTVEDIATAFSVARDGESVTTAVSQGQVRVAARAQGGWTYLSKGQGAQYRPGQPVQRTADVAADSVGAWRQGELLIENRSMDTAIAEVGRYRAGPTFIRGDLSALPAINAAFRVDEPEQALDALAASAGLQVTRLPLGVAIVSVR